MACALAGLLALPAVVLAGIPIQSGLSGSWYDPARDGEGFLLEVDSNDQLVAYWFTYDEDGGQQWVVGAGRIEDSDDLNRLAVPVIATSGAMFGEDFDPADVVRTAWGTLTFEFGSCAAATVDYDSVVGFGSGTISLVPLTVLRNAACEATAPVVVGTYALDAAAGGAEAAFSNCSNPEQNVTAPADDATLVIEQQSGTDVSGTLSISSTVGPGLSVEDAGPFEGTVQENGTLEGNFETTSTLEGAPNGGTKGTFSALVEGSGATTWAVMGITTDALGQTCSLFATSFFQRVETAPQ